MIAILVVGLITISTMSLINVKKVLYSQQQEKVQKVVQAAQSIVDHYHKLQTEGQLTEQQAKAQALEILTNFRYDNSNYVWVNDFEPRMIMHPFKPQLNGKSLAASKDPDGTPLFVNMVKVVKAQQAGFVPYKWPKPGADEPVDKISYVTSVPYWGWILGSGMYVDNVEQLYASQRNTIVSLSLLVLIILSLITYFIGLSIRRPAQAASEMMEDVAEGESDLTKQLNADGKDEIADISHFFNRFIGKIRDSLTQVSTQANDVLNYAKELEIASDKSAAFIQQQSDNTTQVAAAMEQMTANIREVTHNAESAESAAREAQNNTTSGKEVLSTTIQEVESLSQAIDTVNGVINELAQESQNIGAVLDVIRGIAEQTNLLALNAAIEAARAGEQGRGFAVVADEVRTLASKTAQSTDEIDQMIQRLQTEANKAVQAVLSSKELSVHTVESTNEADKVLSSINEQIKVIFDMNSQIARATEQQADAASEVNLRANELATMTNESLANAEGIAQIGHHLTQSSHNASTIVNRFKL